MLLGRHVCLYEFMYTHAHLSLYIRFKTLKSPMKGYQHPHVTDEGANTRELNSVTQHSLAQWLIFITQ